MHTSGNPTWENYPSTATPITAAALENIENALDQHPATPPVLDVRLGSDVTSLEANTWFTMRTGMLGNNVSVDTHGIWGQPASGGSYQATVPAGWAGRWDMSWSTCIDGIGYDPVIVAVCLDIADTEPNGNGVFQATALRNQSPGMGQVNGNLLLNAGQKIALAFYVSRTSGTFNLRAVLGKNRTRFTMRWNGNR